jgi:hypothetical protein
MRARQRLQRLERLRPPDSPTLWLVFVDEEGIVLDDGSDGVRPWIGGPGTTDGFRRRMRLQFVEHCDESTSAFAASGASSSAGFADVVL